MEKNNRCGQAATLTNEEFAKIRRQLKKPEHRLFWDIARYTGERWGAICKLKVSDVYSDPAKSVPRTAITFPAGTRKRCNGKSPTRQVPINSSLAEVLRAYRPAVQGYLFPGRMPGTCISFDNMDDVLRRAIAKAGIVKGVSTHSTRRSAATNLVQKGVSPRVVQEFFGWASLAQVSRYSDVTQDLVVNAAEVL